MSKKKSNIKSNFAKQACQEIIEIIESVENRCIAADGPVTPTTQEITERELRQIYLAAKLGIK